MSFVHYTIVRQPLTYSHSGCYWRRVHCVVLVFAMARSILILLYLACELKFLKRSSAHLFRLHDLLISVFSTFLGTYRSSVTFEHSHVKMKNVFLKYGSLYYKFGSYILYLYWYLVSIASNCVTLFLLNFI